MFNKKGDFILINLFGIVLGAIVFIMFFQAANVIGSEHQLKRMFVAKDVALLIEAGQATPYDIRYEYPETLLGSKIIIGQDRVTVGPDGGEGLTKEELVVTRYPYSLSPFISVKNTTVSGTFFVMTKENNEITFANNSVRSEKTQIIDKRLREEITFEIFIPETEIAKDAEFLKNIKNSLQVELQDDFTRVGPTTLIIGVSLGDKNSIYHSDLGEMKQLAEAVKRAISSEENEVSTASGNKNIGQGISSIEIILDPKYRQKITTDKGNFAYEVSATIDAYYK